MCRAGGALPDEALQLPARTSSLPDEALQRTGEWRAAIGFWHARRVGPTSPGAVPRLLKAISVGRRSTLHTLRKLAGGLMLASAATHLSEPVFFPFSLPLLVALAYGVSFFFIGVFLFRPGERVLLWGAVLPLSAAFLGTANSILQGYMHPITRWHLFVDLVVGPTCIHLLRRTRQSEKGAA